MFKCFAGCSTIDVIRALRSGNKVMFAGNGGSAADAAVAAMAVACVGEPHMTGIGGDCFCLVARPGQPIWGYNGSGRTGAAMRAEGLDAWHDCGELAVMGLAEVLRHPLAFEGVVDRVAQALRRDAQFERAARRKFRQRVQDRKSVV